MRFRPFTSQKAGNRIDQYSSSYAIDGNLLSDGQHTYTYDAENRITSVNRQSTTCTTRRACASRKLSSGRIVVRRLHSRKRQHTT